MAARLRNGNKRPWTPEIVRERIRASMITSALVKHVLGKNEMSASQVTAALGLLRKCIPDLSAIDVEVDGKLATYDISDKPLTADQWAAAAAEANSLVADTGTTAPTH